MKTGVNYGGGLGIDRVTSRKTLLPVPIFADVFKNKVHRFPGGILANFYNLNFGGYGAVGGFPSKIGNDTEYAFVDKVQRDNYYSKYYSANKLYDTFGATSFYPTNNAITIKRIFGQINPQAMEIGKYSIGYTKTKI